MTQPPPSAAHAIAWAASPPPAMGKTESVGLWRSLMRMQEMFAERDDRKYRGCLAAAFGDKLPVPQSVQGDKHSYGYVTFHVDGVRYEDLTSISYE